MSAAVGLAAPATQPASQPAPVPVLSGRVHLVGIGGAGMSAVARVLLGRGFAVSGSDAADVPVLAALAAAGADVAVGFDPVRPGGVAAATTVVVGSAIRPDNPEVLAARAAGRPVLHRSRALAALMAAPVGAGAGGPRRPSAVAVAGTNGKTTTSAMLAALLVHAGRDPSFAIGGDLVGLATNARAGAGDVFVAEADESDASFLVYAPDVAVVTNVQADHLDHYGTLEAVQEAFAAFAARLRPQGVLVACADDEGAAALARRHVAGGGRARTYGSAAGADVRVGGAQHRPGGISVLLEHDGQPARTLALSVPGWHNALDAAGALAAALELGVGPAAAIAGLEAFTGTRRRFELRGEAAGVRVYDDYAHNPPKVAAAVATGRGAAGAGRLCVVFQPHLYSRTAAFAAAFGAALSGADDVVVMDVYGAREDPVPGVDGSLVAAAVDLPPARVAHVRAADGRGAVVGQVLARTRPGDVVVTVGAGDVTVLAGDVLDALRRAGAQR